MSQGLRLKVGDFRVSKGLSPKFEVSGLWALGLIPHASRPATCAHLDSKGTTAW